MEPDAVAIKAIDAGTVHRIQSGQVIVDLCSVAKELVENSFDAGATSIDVRFKNQGLDSIEIQDNGAGISPQNYESIALKHYTSKLSTYADLTTLQTFGFRGEALSSLCALSHFSVVTCLQSEAPKAKKLEFEASGKLKGTSVVAGQRGTTATVEDLFYNLPVRRRELERNIKREWGKVISLLNQYACVQTGVKFSVWQQPNKGRRMLLFSTRGNRTTRDNIINVFGAKTMGALITLDLRLELEMTRPPLGQPRDESKGQTHTVRVLGHVSRPVHGGGRQTPDRQMFYVNGRPCGLPQFAKVFNEVYRSYNSSQSPFIFADIQLDTGLYDVNVSPDKRTILLHDQGKMLDHLRDKLVELFEMQEYTVPLAQLSAQKQTSIRHSVTPVDNSPASGQRVGSKATSESGTGLGAKSSTITRQSRDPDAEESPGEDGAADSSESLSSERDEEHVRHLASTLKGKEWQPPRANKEAQEVEDLDEDGTQSEKGASEEEEEELEEASIPSEPVRDRPGGVAGKIPAPQSKEPLEGLSDPVESETPNAGGPLPNPDRRGRSALSQWVSGIALPHSVPDRSARSLATVSVGNQTFSAVLGPTAKRLKVDSAESKIKNTRGQKPGKSTRPLPTFGGRLSQMFAAAASRADARGGIGTESQEEHESPTSSIEESPEDEESEGKSQSSPAVSEAERNESEGETPSEDSVSQASEEEEAGEEPSDNDDGDDIDNDANVNGAEANEQERKKMEELKVQDLIEGAQKQKAASNEDGEKRGQMLLKGSRRKDTTHQLLQRWEIDENAISELLQTWQGATLASDTHGPSALPDPIEQAADDPEATLSLKISKSDFNEMRIIGQFNLGFIIAVRPAAQDTAEQISSRAQDDLFIIDQHASDEKYNFERLQSSTVVQSQRLVQPKTLELTALEEEIVVENLPSLEANGFVVRVDDSGDAPVGNRVQLLNLPLSRETTFTIEDLEELIVLLGDSPSSAPATDGERTTIRTFITRPSKVRKMFAMRACRSSIMIGRALSVPQMEKVVRHMGEMEKPWNCPHGRPTMRHLCGLGAWDEKGWRDDAYDDANVESAVDWAAYLNKGTGR